MDIILIRLVEHCIALQFKAICMVASCSLAVTSTAGSLSFGSRRGRDWCFDRCLEFNIEANRARSKTESTFILVSNLRGICEDLIYLTYLSKMNKQDAEKWIELLHRQKYAESLLAQRNFFETSNPYQPVIGNNRSRSEAEQSVEESKRNFRDFRRSIPDSRSTIRDMAEELGLTSTYHYIYHASSNFVHFNTQVLLRNAWRDVKSENSVINFSARNMSGYYQSFSIFYAAILFIGYEASFGSRYFNDILDVENARIIKLITAVKRWPEIITFEENNVKPPFYLLTHAIGQLVRKEEGKEPYGEIIAEVLNLKT